MYKKKSSPSTHTNQIATSPNFSMVVLGGGGGERDIRTGLPFFLRPYIQIMGPPPPGRCNSSQAPDHIPENHPLKNETTHSAASVGQERGGVGHGGGEKR